MMPLNILNFYSKYKTVFIKTKTKCQKLIKKPKANNIIKFSKNFFKKVELKDTNMPTIGSRINFILKSNNLKKADFARMIKVSKTLISDVITDKENLYIFFLFGQITRQT